MKSCSARLGLARSLVALSVSLAVVLSSSAFAALAESAAGAGASPKQTDSPQTELQLTSVSATKKTAGVLLQWYTNSTADNMGFNVYRVKDGQRIRANREIIPGAVFAPSPALMRGAYSYSWFDRDGTADSVYYIESVSLLGKTKLHDAVRPVPDLSAQAPAGINPSAAQGADMFEKYYPAAESAHLNLPSGLIEDQWAVAAQSALKIGIKKDGWYRVTQPQMAVAGFNPAVDIRNLQLFVDGRELAISTSQSSGQFGTSDYIEFYGRGLDLPTTDTRMYYLIAGTTPGKRVSGDFQPNGDPDPTPVPTATPPPPPASTPSPQPIATPPPAPVSTPPAIPLPTPPATGPPANTPPATSPPQVLPAVKSETAILRDPVFYSWIQRELGGWLDSSTNRSANSPRVENSRSNESPTSSSPLYIISPDTSYSPSMNAEEKSRETAAGDSVRTGGSNKLVPKPAKGSSRANLATEKSPVIKSTGAATSSPAPKSSVRASNASQFRKASKASKNRKRSRRHGRQPLQARQDHNHALLSMASAPGNFEYVAERKDRGLYFVSLINGDAENYFGQVLSYDPAIPFQTQTINIPNPDLNGAGPAHLEIALQGINQAFHQVTIEFNGLVVGSLAYFGLDPATGGYQAKVFDVPVSQLHAGANTIKFTVAAPGPDVNIVDYVKLTYPHTFDADAGSLKFTLRGTQSRKIDGFATPLVRLIDYTDPFNVSVAKPLSEPSASGHAITVPLGAAVSKDQRLLYAIPQGQFQQPASISLNQPSTLNQGNLSPAAPTGADFLIVSHKKFIPSFSANVSPANTSLLAQRQSQGFIAATVDIDDVYDEFSFGVHGPQAVRSFLSHAATHWTTKPRYIILAGDSSLDPRNYEGNGDLDLVPTKLVDATFSETASDDWMTDFDNDGVGDVPVGRLPFRTVADATLVLSKIVNFTPVAPPSALLVADEDPFHVFGFVETSDLFQSLLPPGMLMQRITRCNVNVSGTCGPGTVSDASLTSELIAGLNTGPSLVNYSGHGNVNVWTSAFLFKSVDALALTNLQVHNKLSFVVVMDCLNGYFQDPKLLSLSEAFLEAPNGGAVAAFASSGLTVAQGQHEMGRELYTQLYGGAPMRLGDAIKLAKTATFDIDVKRTWIFFGDPSMNIR